MSRPDAAPEIRQPPDPPGAARDIISRLPPGLGPSSAWEMLDRGLRLYRENFLLFFCLPLIFLVLYSAPAMAIFGGIMEEARGFISSARGGESAADFLTARTLLSAAPFIGFMLGAFLVVKPITDGALVLAVSERLGGRPVDLKDLLRRAFRRGWPLIKLQLLRYLLYALAVAASGSLTLLVFVPFFQTIPDMHLAPASTFLLLFLNFMLVAMTIFGPFLTLFLYFVLSVPAIVMEPLSPMQALVRSIRLVRVRVIPGWLHTGAMRVTAIFTVIGIIQIVLMTAASLPFTLYDIAQGVSHASAGVENLEQYFQLSTPLMLANLIVSTIFQGIGQPLPLLFMYLFYLDLRIRREGLDILALVEAPPPPAASAPAGRPWPEGGLPPP